MRKPRDYDTELKAINDKAKTLRESKLLRLGELVTATEADKLDIEILAGALVMAVASKDEQQLTVWKKAGEEMFRNGKRSAAKPTSSSVQKPTKAAGD